MKWIKGYIEHIRESQEGTPEELGQRLIVYIDYITPDIEEVRSLIAAGADLNARDMLGKTALHKAASAGYTEIAKDLIEAGAALEARDNLDRTPFHLAASWGHTEIAKALINAGADISAGFDSLDELEGFFGGDTSWIPQESLPPEWRKRHRSRGAFGRF
jgi:ankyrin repeat protein